MFSHIHFFVIVLKAPGSSTFLISIGSILSIIEGCSMVQQTIWPSNHTSHTKVYFNELVANALPDNMGRSEHGHDHFWPPRLWRLLRGHKHHISVHTLVGTQFIPQHQLCLPKIHQRNEISYDSQPPFSLHILNSRTKRSPQGLISSSTKYYFV